MKKTLLTSFCYWLALAATIASVSAQSTSDFKSQYQRSLATYRQQIALFNRDRQLYQQSQNNTALTTTVSSARAAFAARQTTLLDYNQYLSSLINDTVDDETLKNSLVASLAEQSQALIALDSNFDTVASWYPSDSQFAAIYAQFSTIAYQAFAQIYYHQLQRLVEQFATLYQNQNQRILTEASSQVERERKNKILDQTARSLAQLQTQLATIRPQLAAVNGADTYQKLRNELNQLLLETQTSLGLYAQLE